MAKVFRPARSFGRVCRYVSSDLRRSIVLDAEGVRGHDYKLMARDFEIIRSLRETWSRPVFHGVLDFYPKEELDDDQLVKIARAYMQEMGLVNTQYAVVKHIDKEHRHVHIVANRINFEGEHLNLYPAQFRSNDIVRGLAREYGLTPPGQKNLRETNFDALNVPETCKYAIYRGIKESLPGCHDFEELERRLRDEGIEVKYRIDDRTGDRNGISYRYMGFSFKGSDIDREYSYGRLHEKLARQQVLTQWQSEKLELRAVQVAEEQKALQEKEALVQREQRQREEEKKALERQQKMVREEEKELRRQRRVQQQEERQVHRIRIH
jgi:Relaxase/Mobilisation nuclease domain